MDTFSPLDLIQAHPWSHSFFTTYSLSLSFFVAVVLEALVRQNVERTLILADIGGVREAVAEYGSIWAGRVARRETSTRPGPLFALVGNGVTVMLAAVGSAVAGTWLYGLLRPRLLH